MRRLSLTLATLTVMCVVTAGIVQAADAGGPELSLSLRAIADGTVERGEPLSVVVRLVAPRQTAAAIELAPATGTWADAVAVEISPRPGAPAKIRASAVGRPDAPHATLDRNRIAGGLWLFSGASMQELEPGDYVVRVRLKIEEGAGWKGEVVSKPVALKVVAASTAPQRVTQRALSEADEAMLADRGEQAAAILDAILTSSPDNREALMMRAVVAERAGNLTGALICLNRASRGLSANGPPPAGLYELRARLQEKRLQPLAEGETAAPPPWSWPPLSAIQSRGNSDPPTTGPATEKPSPATANVSTPKPAANTDPAVVSSAPVARQAPSIGSNSVNGALVPQAEVIEATILADAAGQWATSAVAGSQYGKTQYSAAQATGAPNISVAGNSPDAWCPASKSSGTDWLEVTFTKPVQATEVRVRQNDAAGAIAKVEAIESNGTAHVWWEGVDPYRAPAVREIAWFAVRVPKTDYVVAKVKITLNLAAGPGWKEIDAVQLVAAP